MGLRVRWISANHSPRSIICGLLGMLLISLSSVVSAQEGGAGPTAVKYYHGTTGPTLAVQLTSLNMGTG